MKNKINAEKKKLNMEGLFQNNSKYGGQIGLLGPDANLKLRPGHPRRGYMSYDQFTWGYISYDQFYWQLLIF